MTRFRCIAMPTADAERFRATGRDDRGQPVIRRVVDGPGFPCRHCLRLGEAGEEMLLLSWDLPRPQGVYWTPSPVFLHARDCARFDEADAVAPSVLANGIVSVRSYDAEQLCLYDLGQVCEGKDVMAPLQRALSDPRTRFVNIHTARPGCWLAGVEAV